MAISYFRGGVLMTVQQLTQGSRITLGKNIGKIDIGIRLKSYAMDIHTVVDIAIVCKSKTKGLYTIWYGDPIDEKNGIYDDTTHCNGSSWNDDDLRVTVNFNQITSDIERMSIVTNILWGKAFQQHCGMFEQGYMHMYSYERKADLLEQHIQWSNHKEKIGFIWAEIYLYKDEWKIWSVEESMVSKDLGEVVQTAGSYL